MGRSSEKKARQRFMPEGNAVRVVENPNAYYSNHPSWNFQSCDKQRWSLFSDDAKGLFWDELMPRIQQLEKNTWSEILVRDKKFNHSIDVTTLNPCAIERLTELKIEAEALVSIRVNGSHRVYGTIAGAVFSILWVDLDHGDNASCVCRSRKKHT